MSNTTAENAKKIFSKKLNYYMNKKGISQSDIAAKFDLTASTVSDWCNGKKYPRVDKIQLLADYFGILKSDLMEDNAVEENTVIFNQNGETIKKKLTKEQMDYLNKFISSISDDNAVL